MNTAERTEGSRQKADRQTVLRTENGRTQQSGETETKPAKTETPTTERKRNG